jgi:hypothetical protein
MGGPVCGPDEFVGRLRDAMAGGGVTVHHGFTPELELLGDGGARAVWPMEDYVELPPVDGARLGLRGYGYYEDEYRRGADGWRISSTRLTRLRVDPLEGPPLPPFEGWLQLWVGGGPPRLSPS